MAIASRWYLRGTCLLILSVQHLWAGSLSSKNAKGAGQMSYERKILWDLMDTEEILSVVQILSPDAFNMPGHIFFRSTPNLGKGIEGKLKVRHTCSLWTKMKSSSHSSMSLFLQNCCSGRQTSLLQEKGDSSISYFNIMAISQRMGCTHTQTCVCVHGS